MRPDAQQSQVRPGVHQRDFQRRAAPVLSHRRQRPAGRITDLANEAPAAVVTASSIEVTGSSLASSRPAPIRSTSASGSARSPRRAGRPGDAAVRRQESPRWRRRPRPRPGQRPLGNQGSKGRGQSADNERDQKGQRDIEQRSPEDDLDPEQPIAEHSHDDGDRDAGEHHHERAFGGRQEDRGDHDPDDTNEPEQLLAFWGRRARDPDQRPHDVTPIAGTSSAAPSPRWPRPTTLARPREAASRPPVVGESVHRAAARPSSPMPTTHTRMCHSQNRDGVRPVGYRAGSTSTGSSNAGTRSTRQPGREQPQRERSVGVGQRPDSVRARRCSRSPATCRRATTASQGCCGSQMHQGRPREPRTRRPRSRRAQRVRGKSPAMPGRDSTSPAIEIGTVATRAIEIAARLQPTTSAGPVGDGPTTLIPEV